MKKRRVTLNLDEDVVEALESIGERSLSSAANDALRRAVALEAHRGALARWLEELDAAHGRASEEEAEAIDSFLDELERSSSAAESA